MSLKLAALLLGFAGAIGIALGYYLRFIIALGRKGSMELEIKERLSNAEARAKEIVSEAETKAIETLQEARKEIKEKEEKFTDTETRLIKKEDLLDRRQTDIDEEVEQLKKKAAEITEMKACLENIEKEKQAEVERISKMNTEEAKAELFALIEKRAEEDLWIRTQKAELATEGKLEERARSILATTIQRLATAVPVDMLSTTVPIQSDEIKGKIIGKEGRNIKAFERSSGVELIIDDTPGAITISSFDPIRREVAATALKNLIIDGRIQPAKIEEFIEKARTEVNKIIKEKGEQAAYSCGVLNLDQRILLILGRLHFRTSYGQNVLQHSIEMSHLAGMLAEELGADVSVAKAGALLHDIGKAVDHEVAGSHVEIGRRILQKFGAPESIIKAMQAHHGEYPYETVESIIVQTCDAISGGRPGARRDTLENYLKRLSDLEAIANQFKGVEKSYALEAGRELRIFVTPAEVTDLEAHELARNVALKIEKDLRYPGEIKVIVIRENRVIEFAR